MRITRWLLAALAIAAVATVTMASSGAQAPPQPPSGRMGFGPPGPPRFPFEQLGLSADQKQQIQSIMDADRQSPPGPALRDLEIQLHQAIFLGTDVTALKQKILDAQAAMLEHQIEHQQKIAAVLTPDQRQKAANMPMGRGGMGRGGRGAAR